MVYGTLSMCLVLWGAYQRRVGCTCFWWKLASTRAAHWAVMRISTSKPETKILTRKGVDCSFWVARKVLHQVGEFKYLRVLFMSRILTDGLGQQRQWCGCQINLPRWFTYQSTFWLWPLWLCALGQKRIKLGIQAVEMSSPSQVSRVRTRRSSCWWGSVYKDDYPWRFSWHVKLEKCPAVILSCPGSSRRSWRALLWGRISGTLCWTCCHRDPFPDV